MWVPDIPAVEMQAADIEAAGKPAAEMQAETWAAVRERAQVQEQAELTGQVQVPVQAELTGQVLQQRQAQGREPEREQVQVPAVRQVQSWLRVFRSFRKRPVRPERRFRMIHNT